MLRKAPVFAAFALALSACSSESPAEAPKGPLAEAVFAGGCFWCTEADFDKMPGVVSTTSGYTGGQLANPTYKKVTAGGTGHIEAVRVVYDPRKISYASLVQRFLRTIDVTDAGGQFCDRGESYRPAIFVGSPQQRQASQAALQAASKQIGKKTAVELLPAARFWSAEGYHQDYYKKNPVRYKVYRWNCGRDQRLKQVWG
ncbi:MAG: peptide-methionine (S)-S-oxide reductase MsrA [Sphingomonas sp.]|nr:peptide-methionine (S)-S-oxide reductase MsrA [Sphingomonas sp.]